MGKKHNRRERRAEISAPEQPPASMADETRLTLTSAESNSEPERSSSTREPGNPSSAETDETVSPVKDQANADPASHAAHDAVSEICDPEGTADAHQHGVAGQDGDHQDETGRVERTETAIAEETIEQDHTDVSDGNEISPGKNSLGKGTYSVACYAESIGESWRHSVEAIMEVARLCVEASERLTPQERRELVDRLPFSDTVFSKFIKIGKSERLQAPDVQRLLPPNWTIIYSLAGLHKYDLDQVIAARVVGPEMRRTDVDKWIREKRAPNSSKDPTWAGGNSIPVPRAICRDGGPRARSKACRGGVVREAGQRQGPDHGRDGPSRTLQSARSCQRGKRFAQVGR